MSDDLMYFHMTGIIALPVGMEKAGLKRDLLRAVKDADPHGRMDVGVGPSQFCSTAANPSQAMGGIAQLHVAEIMPPEAQGRIACALEAIAMDTEVHFAVRCSDGRSLGRTLAFGPTEHGRDLANRLLRLNEAYDAVHELMAPDWDSGGADLASNLQDTIEDLADQAGQKGLVVLF